MFGAFGVVEGGKDRMDGVCNASCQVSFSSKVVDPCRLGCRRRQKCKTSSSVPPPQRPTRRGAFLFLRPGRGIDAIELVDLPGRHSRFKPPGLPKEPARLSARSRES